MGTFATNILPANTGQDLGSTGQRWDVLAQNIDYSGTLTGASINGALNASSYGTLQAAHDALPAGGGCIVLPPNYSTTLSTTLTISKSNVMIVGSGATSVVSWSSSSVGITITGSNVLLKDFAITSTAATTGQPSILASSVSNVELDGITFTGGGQHIQYSSVSNFRIRNTRHVTPTTSGTCIYLVSCSKGVLVSPRIEAFTVPVTSGTHRTIYINTCTEICVVAPIVRDIDATVVSDYAGVAFTASSNCQLLGGVITALKNGDGVVCESGCTDISIDGTVSTGHSAGAGAGANASTGDGFDFFNSSRIRLSNFIARGNGYSSNRQMGVEIYTCDDVSISNGDCSDNAGYGVQIIGSPRTRVANVTASRNFWAGSNVANVANTVNTSGTAVAFTSGNNFGLKWAANTPTIINGTTYLIASVTDQSHLTLTTSAGTQSGVAQSVDSNAHFVLCTMDDNGQSSGGAGLQEGIYFANASTGAVVACRMTDTRAVASKTQSYAIRMENTARVFCVANMTGVNLTGGILDSPATSPIMSEDNVARNSIFPGPIKSTIATGTAPLTIASTTPVANLHCSPTSYGSGGTQQTGMHFVQGSGTLTSATPSTLTVTLTGSAVFANNTSYSVVAMNGTTATNSLKVTLSSGSSFIITGPNTVTDAVYFIAFGS